MRLDRREKTTGICYGVAEQQQHFYHGIKSPRNRLRAQRTGENLSQSPLRSQGRSKRTNRNTEAC